jgi:hypothetical protein
VISVTRPRRPLLTALPQAGQARSSSLRWVVQAKTTGKCQLSFHAPPKDPSGRSASPARHSGQYRLEKLAAHVPV